MSNSLSAERCYGVDVLKTLSMYMVVVLHILGQGGVLAAADANDTAYWMATLLQIATYCAVNSFALATGYLMAEHKARYRKLLPMWLTVAVYSVLGMLAGHDWNAGAISLHTWLYHLFPVSSSEYWYFTAYVCLYLFVPYLNILVESMSRRKFAGLLLTGFILLSLPSVANIANLQSADFMKLDKGYTATWLIYLYLVGAGMKKYGFFLKMSSGKALLGYAGAVALTWLGEYGITRVPLDATGVIASILFEYGRGRLTSYLSPTILAEAVFLSVACINWKVPQWMRKPLVWLSPLLFQVYIIHTHPIPFAYMWEKLKFFAAWPPAGMIAGVLGCAAGIFLVCIVVDWVRYQIFRLLRISRWTDALAQWTMEKLRLTETREKTTV